MAAERAERPRRCLARTPDAIRRHRARRRSRQERPGRCRGRCGRQVPDAHCRKPDGRSRRARAGTKRVRAPHRALRSRGGSAASSPELNAMVADGSVRWMAPQATPAASAAAALATLPDEIPVLLTTGDHALLSAEMVRHFLRGGERDAAAMSPWRWRRTTSSATLIPRTRRTVLKFSDGHFCGCNLFAFLTPRARRDGAPLAAGGKRPQEAHPGDRLRRLGRDGTLRARHAEPPAAVRRLSKRDGHRRRRRRRCPSPRPRSTSTAWRTWSSCARSSRERLSARRPASALPRRPQRVNRRRLRSRQATRRPESTRVPDRPGCPLPSTRSPVSAG